MQPGYTHRTVLFDGLQSAKVPQFYLVCGELVSLRLDFFKKSHPDDVTNDGGCQAEHPGSLNFSAYRQGRDRQEPNEGVIPEAQ